MVVLWSLDLTSELAGVLVYSIACPLLYLFFTFIVGWIDSPSFSIFQKLHLRTVYIDRKIPFVHLGFPVIAPHFKMRLYIEGAIVVIVTTDILSIVIYPPAYIHGWFYGIFEYRQMPNGAHGSSYVLVLSMVIIATLRFDDALKGIIYAGRMVFVHEGLWFPFYYLTNWGDLNIPLDLGFCMWLLSMETVARRKYHMKLSKLSLLPYVGYLLAWLSIGFPITVKNTSRIFFMTKFYGNPYVEAIEVISWMVIFTIWLWNLKRNEPSGWKYLEGIKLSNPLKRITLSLNSKRLAKAGLVSATVLFLAIGSVPYVFGYTVPNTAAFGWSGALTGAQTITIANSGDLLVVNIQIIDSTGAGHTSVSVVSVTDTQSNTFKLAGAVSWNFSPNCSAGNCFDDEVWYGVPSSSGSDTVTVTQSQASGGGSNFEMEDVASQIGNSVIGVTSGTGQGTNVFTTSPITLPAGAFADASVFSACRASGVFSSGTGYTALQGASTNVGDAEYGTANSPPASPTNFSSGCTTNQTWIDLGVVFGVPPTNPLLIVPPSVFSLNYWLFPILFLGLYDGFYLGEGLVAKVSTKGLTFLLIGGFLIGSILAIMMGMIDFEVPLLSVIGFFVYLYRIKA